jgi:hypothetical protein
MLIVITGQIAFMHCFGIRVPLMVALLYLPAVIFVMALPISIQASAQRSSHRWYFAGYVGGDRSAADATGLA